MIKDHRALTASAYVAMLFLGVASSLVGAAARSIGLSATEIGILIAVQNVGFVFSVSISGALADTHQKPRILLAGSLVLAAAFFAFYATPLFALNLLFMLLIGVGVGTYEGVTDAMLFDLHTDRAGRYININHFFVTFGEFLIALYLLFLQLNWRRSVVQSAVAVLMLAVFFALARLPARGGPQRGYGDKLRILTRERLVAMLFLAAVLAVGVELGSVSYLTTFLTEVRGYGNTAAAIGLLVLLAGVASGRLVIGLIIRESRIPQYLLILFASAAVMFGVLLYVDLGLLIWPVIFLSGAALSACLPLILAYAGLRYPYMAGTVLGAIKIAIPIGGIVVPAAMSAIAARAGVHASLVVFPLSFLLGFLLLASARLGRPAPEPEELADRSAATAH